MDICLGSTFDEMDFCETWSEEIHEAVNFTLEKEPAEDARPVSTKSNSAIDATTVASSYPVTGLRGDIPEDYDILPTILGTGHYGCVRECLHRATGEKCAVKTIHKNKAPRLDHIPWDINLLCSTNHPSIMKMADCYKDDNFVHLLTKRYTVGELFDGIVDNTTNYGCWLDGQAVVIIKSLLKAVRYLRKKI